MDKGKGVRKYGRLRQGLRWGKYYVHKKLLVLSVLLVMYVPFFGVTLALYFLSAPILSRLRHIISNALLFHFTLLLVIFGEASIGFLASLMVFRRCFRNTEDNPAFHPVAPTDNPFLPDADLLVRSSASAAQPAELLRAARETTEEKPEELLRTDMESVSENVLLKRSK